MYSLACFIVRFARWVGTFARRYREADQQSLLHVPHTLLMDRTIVIGHVHCCSIQFDVRGSYRTTWKRYNRRPPPDSTGYLDFDCAVTAECHSYNVRGTTWYNMWTSSITHSSPSHQPTSTSSCRDEWRRPAAQQTVVGKGQEASSIPYHHSLLSIISWHRY